MDDVPTMYRLAVDVLTDWGYPARQLNLKGIYKYFWYLYFFHVSLQ